VVNKEGKGVQIEESASLIYNGDFRNDVRHGAGTLNSLHSTDYVYDGQWEYGVKHGQGQLITPTFKYSGSFKNNEFHGYGVHCDKKGNIYDGEWENDKR